MLLAAGCGAGVDLSKSNSPRKTVPINQAGSSSDQGSSGPVEEAALAPDKMRLADPCKLMNNDTLAEFGEPADSETKGFDGCSNFMKDEQNRDLNITLNLGYFVPSTAIENPSTSVEGLPAIEERQGSGRCYVTVVTSSEPPLGARVSVSSKGRPCQVGRQLGGAVIKQLRSAPPRHDQKPGSLVGADACADLDDKAAAGVVGSGANESPNGLHGCRWEANSTNLELTYKLGLAPGSDQGGDQRPVDLDGVKAYQEPGGDPDFATCKLSWAHIPAAEKYGDSQVVELQYNQLNPPKGTDPCGKMHGAAKSLLAKLPKP